MRFRDHSEFGVELMINVQETKQVKTKAIFHSELREKVFFFKKLHDSATKSIYSVILVFIYPPPLSRSVLSDSF